MPTEEQFTREQLAGILDPLIPWGPDHPSWRGASYTDYIQHGAIKKIFPSFAQFAWALLTESPAEGYRFSMALGEQDPDQLPDTPSSAVQLSPSFPAGEWALGSVVVMVHYRKDVEITESYKLITASQQVWEDFVHAPTMLDPDSQLPNYGVIAMSHALQYSEQMGFDMPWDKIGLWHRTTVTRAPLKRESDMARGRFRSGYSANGNNGKASILPLIMAAIAAKVLL